MINTFPAKSHDISSFLVRRLFQVELHRDEGSIFADDAVFENGVGGAIECCCTWPMEYLKTQLQSFRTVKGGPPPPFTGIASGLRYTIRQKGFFSRAGWGF